MILTNEEKRFINYRKSSVKFIEENCDSIKRIGKYSNLWLITKGNEMFKGTLNEVFNWLQNKEYETIRKDLEHIVDDSPNINGGTGKSHFAKKRYET